jgi:hypothetical protein
VLTMSPPLSRLGQQDYAPRAGVYQIASCVAGTVTPIQPTPDHGLGHGWKVIALSAALPIMASGWLPPRLGHLERWSDGL